MKNLLALLLLIPSLSWGVNHSGYFSYMNQECGTLTVDWEENEVNTENYVWGALSGYITAYNSYFGEYVGEQTDNMSMLKEIRNFCRNNPLKKLYEAVSHTYVEVRIKEGY